MSTVAEEFRELSDWADSSPLYERFCHVVADDEDLQEIAAHAPPGLVRPNTFLAAVHYLLARDSDDRLAEYYPSIVDDPRPIDDDLAETARQFCIAREDELVSILESRRTQTNAVRRSGSLYPVFAHLADQVDGPLALIELGASAGLNLLWDRYRYEYHGRVVGVADSPVTINTSLRGDDEPPLPATPPPVQSRVGVDLNPLDPVDSDDADWLRALIWPEHGDRRRVLDGAIEVARETPPRMVEGDMLAELPGLLDTIPPDVPVVVYNTLVLYQVADQVRQDLRSLLEGRMEHRPLHWLSGDGEYGDSEGIRLEWTRLVDGEPTTDLAAVFQQHGEWIEWRLDGT